MAVGGGSRKALWYTYADTGMHYEAYYLCLGGFDLTGVCLFVCLLPTVHKNYWWIFANILPIDVSFRKGSR